MRKIGKFFESVTFYTLEEVVGSMSKGLESSAMIRAKSCNYDDP
jgi:hypothetical protein